MSDEEIAIETLKEVASDDSDTLGDDISPKMAQNILNVISRQQKEIEDLKEKNRHLEIDKSQLKAYMQTCCINKTKIEKDIYELKEIADEDNLDVYAKIDVLEELLEEN